jgi:ATP-dependent Lhr-like helicase
MSKETDITSLPSDPARDLGPRERLVADALPLPPAFRTRFAGRGWELRAHQAALLQKAGERRSCLLIAPTGSGKTLAGFLPSLVDLSRRERNSGSLHTLYISPLKALAADIERNLLVPVRELSLPIRTETRTGDTSNSRKARQRTRPPEILLTTPEQVALLLAHPHAAHLLGSLQTVIVDELHSLAPTKRGDLLSLALARLSTLQETSCRCAGGAGARDQVQSGVVGGCLRGGPRDRSYQHLLGKHSGH